MSRFPIYSSLEAAKFPLMRRCKRAIKGQRGITFRKGELVLACKDSRTRFSIRKVRLPVPAFPINSSCCDVPAAALEAVK
jgi:hypothetical protein